MSLALFFHDSRRAVVCSDDLAVTFHEGVPQRAPGRVSKFLLLGSFIFAALGRSDVCEALRSGTRRLLAAYPRLSVEEVSKIVRDAAVSAWAKRAPASPDAPINSDAVEVAVLGFSNLQGRVRSFVLCSYDRNFAPFETTGDPYNRIFALGAYGVHERPLLEKLTKQMRHAENMAPYWIAWQLKKTMKEMSLRDPHHVGPPSFYAALGGEGFLDLPGEYPLPPAEELASSAAHLVTTVKENALNGAGRLFVGSILTPRAGAPDTTGNADGGSGAQYGTKFVYRMAINKIDNPTTGNGLIVNQQNATDGDLTTSASLQCVGNSGINNASIQLSSPPGLWGPFQSATLYIRSKASVAGLVGGVINVFTLSYGTAYDGSVPFTGGTTVIRSGRSGYGGSTGVTDAISLSTDTNLAKIVVLAGVGTNAPITAGNIALDIYDAWVEVIQ